MWFSGGGGRFQSINLAYFDKNLFSSFWALVVDKIELFPTRRRDFLRFQQNHVCTRGFWWLKNGVWQGCSSSWPAKISYQWPLKNMFSVRYFRVKSAGKSPKTFIIYLQTQETNWRKIPLLWLFRLVVRKPYHFSLFHKRPPCKKLKPKCFATRWNQLLKNNMNSFLGFLWVFFILISCEGDRDLTLLLPHYT